MSGYDNIKDPELIKRFVENEDESAFLELINRHYQRAYYIAYGVLRSQQDSEEVVQDTFVKIHRVLHMFRGDAQFSTWLYRIVKNYAVNKLRWNKRRRINVNKSIDADIQWNGESFSFDLEDDSSVPDEELIFNETTTLIQESMDEVTPTFREALIMRNVENRTYQEITDILGVKMGTVKSRIARGRLELKSILEKKGFFE